MIKNTTNSVSDISYYDVDVTATKSEMFETFGEPHIEDPHDWYSKYTWEFVVDEIPFTIYDWKEKYIDDNTPINWRIASKNKFYSMMAQDEIINELKLYKLS